MSETTCMTCGNPYTAALHFCVQDAPSAKSEAAPLPDGNQRCVVCQGSAGAHLVVAPACAEHAAPDALEKALAEVLAALAKYGGHLVTCRYKTWLHMHLVNLEPDEPPACSCGWDTALKELNHAR